MKDQSFRPFWWEDYELLDLLGVGGMAEVYLARRFDAAGEASVFVLKRMLARLRSDPRFVKMFLEEATRARSLRHPNIVKVLGLDDVGGQRVIIMEHVYGRSLLQILRQAQSRQQGLPIEFGASCVAQILSGLGHAHKFTDESGQEISIIHRDVNPANIFVSFQGEVKLGDFGVATFSGEVRDTKLHGKVGYIAPECLLGNELDARADLFSAGVVLWETLAGRPLYVGAHRSDIFQQIVERQPEPPSIHNTSVPPELDAVALRALARDPAQRFRSAREFGKALITASSLARRSQVQAEVAGVMRELYPEQSPVLELPEPTPRSEGEDDFDSADFSDLVTRTIAVGMDGLNQTPDRPPDSFDPSDPFSDSLVGTLRSDDGGFGTETIPATMPNAALDEDAVPTFMAYYEDRSRPEQLEMEALLALLKEAHDKGVACIGVRDRPPLPVSDLGRLCYWDSLTGLPADGTDQIAEGQLEDISVTRVIYEATVRRMTGTLVFEDAKGEERRLLYLKSGYPLYVASTAPGDGAPAAIRRYRKLDPDAAARALYRSIANREPYDATLVQAFGRDDESAPRIFTALIRSRLFAAFAWTDGHYKAYKSYRPPLHPHLPLPPLLSILVPAVRSALSLAELNVLLGARGRRAVVDTAGREDHVDALRLKPVERRVLEAIDGRRSIPKILERVGAHSRREKRSTLAVLYVLGETRLAELL